MGNNIIHNSNIFSRIRSYSLREVVHMMKCVVCGRKAVKGSMKHPYCTTCFKKKWNNNYDDYNEWLSYSHNNYLIGLTEKKAGIMLLVLLLMFLCLIGLLYLLIRLIMVVIL